VYGELAEDRELLCLLPFYKCYRAYVRGKVESLKSVEQEVSGAERNRAREQARRYFRLALGYATACPQPALVVVCGMVATGKSTVARRLGDRTRFPVLRSDLVRKQLAHIPAEMHMSQRYRAALYSDDFTRLTYRTLLAEAEKHLKTGKGVIVDATFKDSRHRRWALELAADLKVPVFFVECQASEGEIFRRLRERKRRPEEVSDATWDTYLRQREEFTPLRDIPDHCHVVLSSDTPIDETLNRVEKFVCRPEAR
jgi:predicted kinase